MATTPAHAPGAVTVVVTNVEEQSGSLNNGYTYSATSAAPTVSSITPNSGPTTGGTAVGVTGTGFSAGAKLNLDGSRGYQRDGGEQYFDHCHDSVSRSRSSQRDGHKCGCSERNFDEWL